MPTGNLIFFFKINFLTEISNQFPNTIEPLRNQNLYIGHFYCFFSSDTHNSFFLYTLWIWCPPCKRGISDMSLNANNVVNSTYYNKSWAEINYYQMIPLEIEEPLKIIWQLKAAQDLFWSLTITILLEISPMLLIPLLQKGPYFISVSQNYLKILY